MAQRDELTSFSVSLVRERAGARIITSRSVKGTSQPGSGMRKINDQK